MTLRKMSGSGTNAEKTATMMAAAAVMMRAVLASPAVTLAVASPVSSHRSRTRLMRNTS